MKEIDFNKKIFIIAEIGGNHEGNFEWAKRLLLGAAKSGADAVKFQIYSGDKLVNQVEDSERNKHFKKFELEENQWLELIELAKNNDILFMASIWDIEAINKFDKYLEIYKVGSGDLTAYPILEVIAKKQKPIILSTAMTTLKEVKETVKFIEKVNPNLIKEKKLVLLHCVAMYGEPKDEYANLLSIKKLQDEFLNLPIGYSDHTKGIFAAQLAMVIGAKVIEKHFTFDKTREFRDHHISADLNDMKELVKRARQIETLLGEHEKRPVLPIESKERIQKFRRALYFKKDMEKGEIATRDNLIALRPNVGIDAREFYKILGKRLRVAKRKYQRLDYSDFE
jgi:N-acetylneuraminate synthase/N,N'-diacetyllegionaminate synthase